LLQPFSAKLLSFHRARLCPLQRLNEQTCAASEALHLWCERNKNRCYIPEWLLKQWQVSVDAELNGARFDRAVAD